MSIDFHGGQVWSSISPVLSGSGKYYAAIAFLGRDAVNRLPLREGDVLVVNASPSAVVGHATNPYAIENFLNRGVAVYSSERLHAKVVATQRKAIVGSANASAHSAASSEAIVVTDDKTAVRAVREFVLAEAKRSHVIHEDELRTLKKLFDDAGKHSDIPGVNTTPAHSGPFPREFGESYLSSYEEGDLTEEEIGTIAKRGDRRAGYSVHVTQVSSRKDAFEENSIVFFHDGSTFEPPALIAGPVVDLPTAGGPTKFGQCMWRKSGQRAYQYSTIATQLAKQAKILSDDDLRDGYLKLDKETAHVLLTRWFR